MIIDDDVTLMANTTHVGWTPGNTHYETHYHSWSKRCNCRILFCIKKSDNYFPLTLVSERERLLLQSVCPQLSPLKLSIHSKWKNPHNPQVELQVITNPEYPLPVKQVACMEPWHANWVSQVFCKLLMQVASTTKSPLHDSGSSCCGILVIVYTSSDCLLTLPYPL